MCLKYELEKERNKLHALVAKYGFNDERVLEQSRKLDCLVLKAQKSKVQPRCTF